MQVRDDVIAGITSRPGAGSLASRPVDGISAAAGARSRTLGEARWSPDGAHLAWLEAFGGRVGLVVEPADESGPAVPVTAE